ncbi:MAG: DUF1194 domain-containing protein [Rhodospirillaceae bacterium]|nr:DUF1194 domain-containing protein [Rhodospirillaceae bacterium]MBT5941833.1 DUF1194 domain-containing protein [Rhodospirillaceae bacterium]MBT7268765.1 DUF1194 domain-containing protein [Rhodospirillaceae bacterium]
MRYILALISLLVTSNWVIAEPIKVDLELVIATDVSRSIDEDEARLQREGVAAALRSPYVLAAIRSGYHKKIAIAYIDYSSRDFNEIVVDWQIVKDKASADKFADALTNEPLTFGRRTSISDALEMAAEMIRKNNFTGTRLTIDVAGDGPNNHGRLVEDVRNEVMRQGITINGLPIINDNGGFGSRFHLPDLDKYYRGCVIGGAGAFLIVARDFPDFARAIRRKLIFEIAEAAPPKVQLLKIATSNGEPPSASGFVYQKGCDIGERMREQIWDDP